MNEIIIGKANVEVEKFYKGAYYSYTNYCIYS